MIEIQRHVGAHGAVDLRVTRNLGDLRQYRPRPIGWRWQMQNWLAYRRRDAPKLAGARVLGFIPGLVQAEAVLRGQVYQADTTGLAPWARLALSHLLAENVPVVDLPRFFGGRVLDYGVLSTRVITTAGVNFLTDAFQGTVEPENMKFHAFGTGVGAEAVGDTALGTEETTQYNPDNTRPTGSQTEGASANIYRTVGTYSPDSGGTRAIL
jgi:hypothetical protein